MSPRFRRIVGRGIGDVARGAMTVGSPLSRGGRDIYDNARGVAAPPRTKIKARAPDTPSGDAQLRGSGTSGLPSSAAWSPGDR